MKKLQSVSPRKNAIHSITVVVLFQTDIVYLMRPTVRESRIWQGGIKLWIDNAAVWEKDAGHCRGFPAY